MNTAVKVGELGEQEGAKVDEDGCLHVLFKRKDDGRHALMFNKEASAEILQAYLTAAEKLQEEVVGKEAEA